MPRPGRRVGRSRRGLGLHRDTSTQASPPSWRAASRSAASAANPTRRPRCCAPGNYGSRFSACYRCCPRRRRRLCFQREGRGYRWHLWRRRTGSGGDGWTCSLGSARRHRQPPPPGACAATEEHPSIRWTSSPPVAACSAVVFSFDTSGREAAGATLIPTNGDWERWNDVW